MVDPQPQLHYSGMTPAVLGGWAAPCAARIPVHALVHRLGGRFVQSYVQSVERPVPGEGPVAVRTAELTMDADVVSIAAGSRVQLLPGCKTAGICLGAKPVAGLLAIACAMHLSVQGREPYADGYGAGCSEGAEDGVPMLPDGVVAAIQRWASGSAPLNIVVVGGGPSGVELAGNLARRIATLGQLKSSSRTASATITVIARSDRLLSAMPDAASEAAAQSLRRLGVMARHGRAAERVTSTAVILDNGEAVPADAVVMATGLLAPGFVSDSPSLPQESGFLLVDQSLSCDRVPVLGGGDAIRIRELPLPRIGVHAVRQGPILLHNIRHSLGLESDSNRYEPPDKPLLIINPGDGTGIAVRGNAVVHNRAMLAVKLRIDWGFVRSAGLRTRPSLLRPPRRCGP